SVHQKLLAMDIFVLPSFNEGNSNAILEAMAAGLPVVSTRVGGTPMQVGPEGAGFLSTPGDIEGLATNISTLVRDPALCASLGQAMRVRAERHFDIRKIARTYAKAYSYLQEGKRNQIFEASDPIITDQGQPESIQGTPAASLEAA
ncbi:MAG: glycosyltransferase family 4 protein, partial [Rhodomicrobium sp.]